MCFCGGDELSRSSARIPAAKQSKAWLLVSFPSAAAHTQLGGQVGVEGEEGERDERRRERDEHWMSPCVLSTTTRRIASASSTTVDVICQCPSE